MNLQVIGAGLPRTGTKSLKVAIEYLLGGRCYDMSAIPEHPFDLGADWDNAITGKPTDWNKLLDGYNAVMDWPASMFWSELSKLSPDSIVMLSVRDDVEEWWQSFDATVLLTARMALAPDWRGKGQGLIDLLERFAGTSDWDDRSTMITAYERYNTKVRETVPNDKLLEWQVTDGWEPICRVLGQPVPNIPFPWTNKRSEWG